MINIYSKPLMILLVILLLILQYELWFSNGGVTEIYKIKRSITNVEELNAELSEKNAVLAADVNDLRHGDEAIEERARQDLGMIKKNEIFYQIID